MKKIFIAIAFCAMSLIACNKQQIDTNIDSSSNKIVIRAHGEDYDLVSQDGATKATINASKQIEWAAGDMIGVRLYKGSAITGTDGGSGYGAWDATFTLDAADAGKTNGSFTCPSPTDEWLKAYAAWYPRYEDTDQTNIGGDAKLYFYLRSWYDGYTSGTSLMPMMADMSSWSESNTDISFKHVGAGVRVTLKDVPGAANQASLTVTGKNISGWYTVEDPTTAGTATISAGDGTDNNTVYLKFATASAKRDMTFIFPLPTVDLSGGIEIKLYYDTDHKEFWSRKASTVPVSLGRGEVLDMPDITVNRDPEGDVTLYFACNTPVTNSVMFKSSKLGTASWPGDDISADYEIIAGRKFYKVVRPASSIWGQTIDDMYIVCKDTWNTSASSGDFSKPKMAYYFEATSGAVLTQLAKRPSEPKITIDGTFTDWTNVGGNTYTDSEGTSSTLKAYSDGTNFYLYNKMAPGTGITFDLAGWRYFRLYFDKDNDATTGWDTSHWLYAGADEVLYGEGGDKHCFLIYHTRGGLENATIESVSSSGTFQLKTVSNSDGTIEVELMIPMSELGTLSGNEMKIYISGSVASGHSCTGILGGIMIPTVTP